MSEDNSIAFFCSQFVRRKKRHARMGEPRKPRSIRPSVRLKASLLACASAGCVLVGVLVERAAALKVPPLLPSFPPLSDMVCVSPRNDPHILSS